MTVTRHILERPPQFQWDADSAPCKPDNCRPTCVAMIAGFYKDKHYSPTYARKVMQGGSNACGGTSNVEEVRGLGALGVPASTGYLTPTQVKSKAAAGIPVSITVYYARIPRHRLYRTDFTFYGWHSVVVCSVGTGKDHMGRTVPGIWVRDPDHGSPSRPERPNKTFWPDWMWSAAFKKPNMSVGIAVWPKAKKVVPAPVADPVPYVHTVEVIANDVNVRDDPSTISKVITKVNRGARIRTTHLRRSGGPYTVGGVTRRDWLGYSRNGNTVWVARAYTKLIS